MIEHKKEFYGGFGLLIGFAVGLIVGWNFLPQPQAIKDVFGKLKGNKEE